MRIAAALSLCAVLVPAACDSPVSPPEVGFSAAVTGNGTVRVTSKEVVPIDDIVAFAVCLNGGEGELVKISGELGVVHNLTLTPASGGKTYLMHLDSQVWSQGIRGVGLQSATELLALGADKVQVTREVTLPVNVNQDAGFEMLGRVSHSGPAQESDGWQLTTRFAVDIAEDYGITTTLEAVEITCAPPDIPDGTIINTVREELSIAEEVTTPCFNDGIDEDFAFSGQLGVLHHLKLEPVAGKETYLLSLDMHAWSQGIRGVGLQSATELLAVGADKVQVSQEVTLPTAQTETHTWRLPLHGTLEESRSTGETRLDLLETSITVEIAEDLGITTTLDGIEIVCPPPPNTEN